MKLILLTGLDGAGKSTFFSRISSVADDETGILNLPNIDPSVLPEGILKEAAIFLNSVSSRADSEKDVLMKSFALFSSMLLFRNLVDELAEGKKQIICERHPLIDTQIYALFYASRLDPKGIDRQQTYKFYNSNRRLIDFICSASPAFKETTDDRVFTIFEFVFNWFIRDKKFSSVQLKSVFPVELPDIIYYLRADTEILLHRLKERESREAHENFRALQRFDKAYLELLEREGLPCQVFDTGSMSQREIELICKTITGE